MFAVFAFDDTAYTTAQPESTPMPDVVYEDPGNTSTGGNTKGTMDQSTSGQLPEITMRRDLHGADAMTDG